MKLLFDLFPVILFFASFKYSEKNPELAASWVSSLLGSAAVDIKQAPILLAIVVVFGGLPLAFQNEAFIKWKPTILYWVFAGSMALSALILKKNPIKAMLGEQMTLPEAVWGKVNLSWIGFFLVMGALNLIVAFNFPTDTWVNFKLFGGMGLMLAFVLAQGMLLSKYIEEEK